ncbi:MULTISPECIES: pyocin knob domain-containing protein [Aphanothece]|uniref:pyocin knob domain-containing protein n=1 Tax=Aphanothece TaxID=1121 RepID=UPI0039849D6F
MSVPRARVRLGLLWLLAGWAALLSLDALIRPAAVHPGAALPQQLRRDGVAYGRLDPAPPPPSLPLPPGVVLLEAADYRPLTAAAPQPLIRLRLLGHSRTGESGVFPLAAISQALNAPADGAGACVVLDASGMVTQRFSSEWEHTTWVRSRPVPLHERLAWLAGLRPYRANSCLWQSASAP